MKTILGIHLIIIMFHCHLFHIYAFCVMILFRNGMWLNFRSWFVYSVNQYFPTDCRLDQALLNYWILFHCSNNASLFIINVPFYFHRRLQFEGTDPSAYTAVYFVTVLNHFDIINTLIIFIILIRNMFSMCTCFLTD